MLKVIGTQIGNGFVRPDEQFIDNKAAGRRGSYQQHPHAAAAKTTLTT